MLSIRALCTMLERLNVSLDIMLPKVSSISLPRLTDWNDIRSGSTSAITPAPAMSSPAIRRMFCRRVELFHSENRSIIMNIPRIPTRPHIIMWVFASRATSKPYSRGFSLRFLYTIAISTSSSGIRQYEREFTDQ